VFAVATALYATLASAGVTWGDAGDLTAAAHALGISHPPGHAAHALLGKLAALLVPVGEIGFRVALVSAVAMGAALSGVVALARRLVPASDGDVGLDAGLVGAGLAAASPLVLDVGTRAAVFAPAAALIVWSLVAVLDVVRQGEARRVLLAALGVGLASAFHPLAAAGAGLVMTAAVVVARRRGLARVAPFAAGLALLGMAAHAYLAARSGADLPALLTPRDTSSAAGLWQYVAGPFVRPGVLGLDVAERFAALFLAAGHSTGLGILLGGTIGLALATVTRLRGAGTALAAALAVVLAAALADPRDPDRAGLVLPALLIFAAGLAPLCAAILRMLPRELAGPDARLRRAVAAAVLVPLVGIGLVGARGPALDRGDDPARLWAATAGRVPAGPGLYFAAHPHSLFAGSYEQVVAGARPDIALASQDLARDEWFLRQIKRTRPELYVPWFDDRVAGNLPARLAISNVRRDRPVGGDQPAFGQLMSSHARPLGRGFQFRLEAGDAGPGESALPPLDFDGAIGRSIAALAGLARADYEAERGRLGAAALAAGLAPRFGRERMDALARSKPRADRPALLGLLPRLSPVDLHEPWLTDLLADDLAWRAGLDVPAPGPGAPPERRLHAQWRALLTGALEAGSAPLFELGGAAARATTRLLATVGTDAAVEKHVRALLERTPNDAASMAILASVLFRRGDAAGAEAMFRKSIAIAPRVAETHARLSAVLASRGKRAEARAEWERAVELDPALASSADKPTF
jgi:tetratricopeptide (TPR) repeat protein